MSRTPVLDDHFGTKAEVALSEIKFRRTLFDKAPVDCMTMLDTFHELYTYDNPSFRLNAAYAKEWTNSAVDLRVGLVAHGIPENLWPKFVMFAWRRMRSEFVKCKNLRSMRYLVPDFSQGADMEDRQKYLRSVRKAGME